MPDVICRINIQLIYREFYDFQIKINDRFLSDKYIMFHVKQFIVINYI